MDLSVMAVGELQKLRTRIEKEIENRNKRQRGQAMEEIKSIVAKYGLKLDDVIGRSLARKPRNGASGKTAAKPEKPPSTILYRHPENPALTWSGGRGRHPQWIKEWEASGRSLDEARITNG